MSNVTPSTALTNCVELGKRPVPATGKCTFRSLIEIIGCPLLVILSRHSLRKPRQQNGRANGDRESVRRTAEIRECKSLRRVRSAARMDNLATGEQGREAGRESDKASQVPRLDQEQNATTLACKDCRIARTVRLSGPARRSFPRT